MSDGTSINYKLGFLPTTPNVNDMDWALGEAKSTEDCIIVMGISGAIEGEEGDAIASPIRGDRNDIKIPEHQMQFLRACREKNRNRIVTVLTGGSPLDIKEVSERADAVVMAWYPGQEGGMALGDLVFGDANFSGRLPLTFPLSVDPLPAFDDYSMKGRTYKYMDNENIMYPFGYGLTYGNVKYSDAVILNPKHKGKQPVDMNITLTNNSNFPVDEVVQVYVSSPDAGTLNPYNSLVNFKRVTLEPNSSKIVDFKIFPDPLMMVQEDGEKKLLNGNYTIPVS